MKETIQDLIIEIETIKKIQRKGIQEMENLDKWTETTDLIITYSIQGIEKRITDFKDPMEEMDS